MDFNHQKTNIPLNRLIEKDPNGKDPHKGGAKLDSGKNRMGLVLDAFALALLEVGKVGTYGATKYTDNGWEEVENGLARYNDAMLRHHFEAAAYKGEPNDKDTNISHLAHRAWNALATLEKHLREEKDKEKEKDKENTNHNISNKNNISEN